MKIVETRRTSVVRPISLRTATPALGEIWLKSYLKAMEDGYRFYPSGDLTDDPHCAAMAALCGVSYSGRWPECYGGGEPVSEEPQRWSATRLAALATFEAGIGLGLSPKNAARGVGAARQSARASLGIRRDFNITIERWLRYASELQKKINFQLQRREMWRKSYHFVHMMSDERYPGIYPDRNGSVQWLPPPRTSEQDALLESYRKCCLEELLTVADFYEGDSVSTLIKHGDLKAADVLARGLDLCPELSR